MQTCAIIISLQLLIPYLSPRRRRRSSARPQRFHLQREGRDAGRARQERDIRGCDVLAQLDEIVLVLSYTIFPTPYSNPLHTHAV